MKKGSRITVIVLAVIVIVLLAMLMNEATSGPVFRAADHDSFEDCVANIPSEWLPGSLDYDGAETSCRYVHRSGR